MPYSGVATDETLLISGAAADAKIVGDKFKEIIDQLAELNYRPITIDNFKISEVTFSDGATQQSNICEVGREITSIKLSWQLNKPAKELRLNDEIIDKNKTSYVCESLSIKHGSAAAVKQWLLRAVDERDGVSQKTAAVNF